MLGQLTLTLTLPLALTRCFDDVAHLRASRTFVFRGTADAAAAPGAAESVVGLLAQMVPDSGPSPSPNPNPKP